MMQWRLFVLVLALGVACAQREWWQTATFYQVYPRSHKDTNDDGVGDIKGITEKIPHFVDAGVTCVWLSPIYESPMADFGYDISNFTAIDPIFGTWDDFVEMSNAIKAAGLRLVMDVVPNHSSDQHEWFQKSIAREDPYTDYYVWKPSKGLDANGSQIPPNNWISAFAGSAWEWNEQRQQFYLHQFTVQQPDLDFRNPLVVQEMKDVLQFWLENGVDGFRLDAPGHYVEHIDFLDEPPTNDPDCPPDQFCQLQHVYTMNQPESVQLLYEFRQVINQYEIATGEQKVMMSEPTNDHDVTMSFYGNATHPIMDFPFNVDFILNVNNESTAFDYVGLINKWMDTMPLGATANWVIGNHDQRRIATRQGSGFALTTIMVTQLLPGVVVTYYGEEISMENTFISWEETQDPQGCNAGPEYYERYSRDPQRTPFQWSDELNAGFSNTTPWLPVNDNYMGLNLEAQKAMQYSPFKVYQALTTLRNTLPAVKRGSLDLRVVNSDVFAFTRELLGQTSVLVAANTAYTPKVVDLKNVFFALPEQGTVQTASVNSTLQSGDIVDFIAVPLEARGGIVITF